jgi:hypothetical protein
MGAAVGTRSLLFAAAVVLASLAGSAEAHAMGAIISSPAGASAATQVRVAVSSTGTRTSRWASIHVHGQAATFAWVVPVKSNAFVDLASDAWLEALEDATAPRVIPPYQSPPCGPGGVEVEGNLSHLVTTAPDASTIAPDAATLASTLAAWGLSVPGELAPLVDAAGAEGDSFLVLRYSSATADVVTRTVRIVDGSADVLPLGWTSGPGSIEVVAYAFTNGGASVGTEALSLPASAVLWTSAGTSTYAAARDALLGATPGAWLIETAGPGPVFEGQVTPVPVPSLASAYFTLASTYGDATQSAPGCNGAAAAVSTSASPVAVACAAGSLAKGADATCDEVVESTDVSPDALRCGGVSDDLALALSGLTPSTAWVTRARSVVESPVPGDDAPIAASAAEASGPVVTCAGYQSSCGGSSSGSTAPSGGGSTGGGSAASGGGSGGATGGGDQGSGSDVGSTVGTVAGAALESSDGCGGDSSDGSGDSCSGSGDSSGSDGASSAGDCSGDSTSSGDCATTQGARRSRHSPASRVLVTLVAIAALARRTRRTKTRCETSESSLPGR